MFKDILNDLGLAIQIVYFSFTCNTMLYLFRSLCSINNRLGMNALVNVPGSVIKYTQHWDNTIRCSICSTDVASSCTDIMNMKTNTPRPLGDKSTIF